MADYPWFRVYNELINDPKIKRVARSSGQSKTTVIGVWVGLLCLASAGNERGCLKISDDIWMSVEDIADELDTTTDLIENLIYQFNQVGMVDLGHMDSVTIANWEKRQGVDAAERARAGNARRQREYRARKRAEKQREKEGGNVTRNVTVTESNVKDIDKEKDIYIYDRNGESDQPFSHIEANPFPEEEQASEQVQEYVSAISGIVKETWTPKREVKFNNAAQQMIDGGYSIEQIKAFGEWWKVNYWYSSYSKPAITTLLDEIDKSVGESATANALDLFQQCEQALTAWGSRMSEAVPQAAWLAYKPFFRQANSMREADRRSAFLRNYSMQGVS